MIVFLGVVIVLIVSQNFVAVGLAKLLGVDALVRNSCRLIICGRTRMERDANALYCVFLRVQRDAQLLFQPFP